MSCSKLNSCEMTEVSGWSWWRFRSRGHLLKRLRAKTLDIYFLCWRSLPRKSFENTERMLKWFVCYTLPWLRPKAYFFKRNCQGFRVIRAVLKPITLWTFHPAIPDYIVRILTFFQYSCEKVSGVWICIPSYETSMLKRLWAHIHSYHFLSNQEGSIQKY